MNLDFKYSKNFTITNNLLDCHDYLKMSSILDVSQEIAGRHADLLSVGFNDFIKKDLIWIVVRNKFEILKDVNQIKELDIETGLIRPRMFEFPRDYSFKNNGEEIIRGRSVWMIYNIKEKRPVIPNDIDVLYSDDLGFYQRVRKLNTLNKDLLKFEKEYIVQFSSLDHNGHMNNTHYTDFYYDIYKPSSNEIIESFQVEYLLQCYLGDAIDIFSYSFDNKRYIYGYKNDKLAFYLEVVVKIK